jgi:hypothetical protein
MLALEIDRLNEIDDSIKDQLKQAGFNSIKKTLSLEDRYKSLNLQKLKSKKLHLYVIKPLCYLRD